MHLDKANLKAQEKYEKEQQKIRENLEIYVLQFSENYNKYSCKGIQKNQNEISKDRFHNVLFNNVKDMCINKGFRVINNEMITYLQHKTGLSYYYDKRQVLPDGVSTIPLNI